MMLDIVMPHYNEPWETVRPFYDMLGCQKGIDFNDFRVILVHDGTDPFPDETFSSYPYKVEQHRIEHKGVSAARNHGMDIADAKWITFCDCDDTYSGIYSLKFVFDVLGTDNYDLLWGSFFTESKGKDGGLFLTANDKFNMIWTHNKYYRLDYLRKEGMRFQENLCFSEDSAFNAVLNVKLKHERIGKIKSPMPLYVWCYREGSATTNKDLTLKNLVGHHYRNRYVTESYYDLGNEDADVMVMRTLTDAYVALTRKDIPDDMTEFENVVREYLHKYKDAIGRVPRKSVEHVMKASMREAVVGKWLNLDRPSFGDWLRQLERKGG